MRKESNNVTDNHGTNFLPDSLGWDAMIRDAKRRIEELRFSIAQLEKKKAAGEPWPGVQSGDQGARNKTLSKSQFPAS
jgi:hypothetical protein